VNGINSKVKNRMRLRLIDMYGAVCAICHEPGNTTDPTDRNYLTIDHILPRSRGGRTAFANFRLAHRRCNSKKDDNMIIGEFWPAEEGE
jgi:5-methylcytosine-specific restriction endonuclease McrA